MPAPRNVPHTGHSYKLKLKDFRLEEMEKKAPVANKEKESDVEEQEEQDCNSFGEKSLKE